MSASGKGVTKLLQSLGAKETRTLLRNLAIIGAGRAGYSVDTIDGWFHFKPGMARRIFAAYIADPMAWPRRLYRLKPGEKWVMDWTEMEHHLADAVADAEFLFQVQCAIQQAAEAASAARKAAWAAARASQVSALVAASKDSRASQQA